MTNLILKGSKSLNSICRSKKYVILFSVAEMSVDEMSVAEMSWPKRPWPKCPWPKCPSTGVMSPGPSDSRIQFTNSI